MFAGTSDLFLAGPLRDRLFWRSAVGWLGLRFMAGYMGVGFSNPALPPLIALMAGTMVYLDLRTRGEDHFLGNLGISRPAILVVCCIVPLLLDIVVTILVSRL